MIGVRVAADTDPGGDTSVLCEFRSRLIDGGAGPTLLETMLSRFKERGLLKARGQQRPNPRELTLRPRSLHEALQNVRTQQETDLGAATITRTATRGDDVRPATAR